MRGPQGLEDDLAGEFGIEGFAGTDGGVAEVRPKGRANGASAACCGESDGREVGVESVEERDQRCWRH